LATAILELGMADQKRMGRPRGDRDDAPVKIDRRLLDQARMIAAHRRVSIAELLSTMLKSPIERAHAQMVKDLNRSAGTDNQNLKGDHNAE
jgi:hypothetical protein